MAKNLGKKFSKAVGEVIKKEQPRKYPLWKGPEVDGITFSLLSRFLVCRERFRLRVVEGLHVQEGFNHRLEYGNMWHVCEETYARVNPKGGDIGASWDLFVDTALKNYCSVLCKKYPLQQSEVMKWWNVCRIQFPLYVKFWERHPDVTSRTPLFQEKIFNVPYTLPSGRVVRLRGKWDSVDIIGSGRQAGIYLQENKTKGDVNLQQIQRQLSFDLQTMMYMVALQVWEDDNIHQAIFAGVGFGVGKGARLKGVRYNVIRRPLSGGKGTIVRHKPTKSNPQGESEAAYYERLGEIIKEDPGSYFMRWKADITTQEVDRFRRECLDPILEQLCDWWEWVCKGDYWNLQVMQIDNVDHPIPVQNCMHWRHPFGVYNVLDEGGYTDVDEFLQSGSTVGLQRSTTLFPELEE